MGLALQNTQTFASMLEILGVGVLSRQDDRRADAFINRMIVPRNRHAEQLCHALGLYPMAWLHADGPDARSRQAFAQAHCYFEKPPLWHIFYTGETAFTRGSR